jgi:hypothetical protein
MTGATRTWMTPRERDALLVSLAAEQRELRERQDVILLALGLGVPESVPAGLVQDPWDDAHDEVFA